MSGKNPAPVLSPSFKGMIVVIVVLSLAVLVDAVIGRNGIIDLQQKRERYEMLNNDVRRLQQEMDRLEAERLASETDPQLLEQIAREKLGLVREGEMVYILQEETEKDGTLDEMGAEYGLPTIEEDDQSTDIDGTDGE